jgi:hypothetical protein
MNTNLKRAIVGLALLFSMGMANATAPTVTNMHDLTSYGSAGYPAYVSLGKNSGSFSDVYNFSIPSLSDVTGDVANLYVSHGGIDHLSLTLQGGPNSIFYQNLPTGRNDALIEQFLGYGNYSFTVAGNAAIQGGKYFFNATALPVPEPSTWAMMLGGLGLIGFMSYRRRQYL